MGAAQGIVTFERPNHTRFSYSVYFDDTANNPVRWLKDGKAGATSPDWLVMNEPLVAIQDICLAAASGQTTTVVKINDLPVSTHLNALHLASITTRPEPAIFITRGQKLTMIQVA